MALTIDDCDLKTGTIQINKAIVLGREKDRTKTREDREIALCGRALAVLKHQVALREALVRAGRIEHRCVFFQEGGARLVELNYPYDRWRYVVEQVEVRYRDPYNARHSFISWSLMIGKNILKLAEEDGHSVQTMLSTYAAWTKDATEADVETIRRAMGQSPIPRSAGQNDPQRPRESPETASRLPVGDGWGRLSWRKRKFFNNLDWRSGREPQSQLQLDEI